MSDKLPIIMVAPHAHSTINNGLRKRVALSDWEIWKCSDPFTGQMKEFTCATFKHVAKVNRLICDLNRAPNVHNAFREMDFFGRQVFKEGKEFTTTEKENLLMRFWHPFHQEIIESVHKLDDGKNEVILMVDYHNTAGDHALNQDRDYMAAMILSNLGAQTTGKKDEHHPVISMKPNHIAHLRDFLAEDLQISVEINTIYTGGYNLYWYAHLRDMLKTKAKIYSVQIEYNLDYIYNPISHQIDEKALHKMQRSINKGLISLYNTILDSVSKKKN